ncbi:MAG TPA: diguanylate cyclase [Thermotogota bacterium]|nr:diguanylate cyclase [Thermotogota bacterium]HRW91803.1 diguanylate cyclase [Thermotogota bacterium]
MKILIADDDITTRLMLKGLLTHWGYDVVEAQSGEEALQLFERPAPPSLAIIDWVMPGLKGPEVCRILREREAKAPLYLILLTSRGDKKDLVEALESGADDFVSKPYDKDELLARLNVGLRMVTSEMEQLDILERLKNSEKRLQRLLELETAISQVASSFISLDVPDFESEIQRGLEKCSQFLVADRVSISNQFALGKKGVRLSHPFSSHEREEKLFALSQDLLGYQQRNNREKESLVLQNVEQGIPGVSEIDLQAWEDAQIRSVVIAPLFSGNALVGFLELDRGDSKPSWREEEIEAIRTLSFIFGNLLTEKQKEEEMEILSITDPLTGCLNRRKGNQLLQEEVARSKRYNKPFSCIMFDLDHFKEVNDNYGHDVGDLVLQSVAKATKEAIREVDYFIRWGGEEFLVLLPETSGEFGQIVAERLRTAFETLKIEGIPTITASFGVASFQSGQSESEIIKKVDENLYAAKKGGRNRVVVL